MSVVGYAGQQPCNWNNETANLIRVKAEGELYHCKSHEESPDSSDFPDFPDFLSSKVSSKVVSECVGKSVVNQAFVLAPYVPNKLGKNGENLSYCSVTTDKDGFFTLPQSFLNTTILTLISHTGYSPRTVVQPESVLKISKPGSDNK